MHAHTLKHTYTLKLPCVAVDNTFNHIYTETMCTCGSPMFLVREIYAMKTVQFSENSQNTTNINNTIICSSRRKSVQVAATAVRGRDFTMSVDGQSQL